MTAMGFLRALTAAAAVLLLLLAVPAHGGGVVWYDPVTGRVVSRSLRSSREEESSSRRPPRVEENAERDKRVQEREPSFSIEDPPPAPVVEYLPLDSTGGNKVQKPVNLHRGRPISVDEGDVIRSAADDDGAAARVSGTTYRSPSDPIADVGPSSVEGGGGAPRRRPPRAPSWTSRVTFFEIDPPRLSSSSAGGGGPAGGAPMNPNAQNAKSSVAAEAVLSSTFEDDTVVVQLFEGGGDGELVFARIPDLREYANANRRSKTKDDGDDDRRREREVDDNSNGTTTSEFDVADGGDGFVAVPTTVYVGPTLVEFDDGNVNEWVGVATPPSTLETPSPKPILLSMVRHPLTRGISGSFTYEGTTHTLRTLPDGELVVERFRVSDFSVGNEPIEIPAAGRTMEETKDMIAADLETRRNRRRRIQFDLHEDVRRYDPSDFVVTEPSDDGSHLDVMILYTRRVMCLEVGLADTYDTEGPCPDTPENRATIETTIALSVFEANGSYRNSGVNTVLRLVHTAMLPDDFDELTYGNDLGPMLDNLQVEDDGVLDDVSTWRERYGADVVSMYIESSARTGGCGLAYTYNGFRNSGFSICKRECLAGFYCLAHEIGHNQGCYHNREDTAYEEESTYAFGWRDPAQQFRTIMAYECDDRDCGIVPYFSNDDILYDNSTLGNATHDNVRRINELRDNIAEYMTVKERRPSASPTASPMPTATSEPTLPVTDAPSPKPTNPITPAPTTFLKSATSLVTEAGQLAVAGALFDVRAKPEFGVSIVGFDVMMKSGVTDTILVFTKNVTHVNWGYSPHMWTSLLEETVTGLGDATLTPLEGRFGEYILPGDGRGFNLATASGTRVLVMDYPSEADQAVLNWGDVRISNEHLDITYGSGLDSGPGFGPYYEETLTFLGRVWYTVSPVDPTENPRGSGWLDNTEFDVWNAATYLPGVQFDVQATLPITITHMACYVIDTGAADVDLEVWTKDDTHRGFEKNQAAWTPLVAKVVRGMGYGNMITIPDEEFADQPMNAGDLRAFFVLTPGEGQNMQLAMEYKKMDSSNTPIASNDDLVLMLGQPQPFGFNAGSYGAAATFAGRIYYRKDYDPPTGSPTTPPTLRPTAGPTKVGVPKTPRPTVPPTDAPTRMPNLTPNPTEGFPPTSMPTGTSLTAVSPFTGPDYLVQAAMFDVHALGKNVIRIVGFDLYLKAGASDVMHVFTKDGTHDGFQNAPGSWDALFTESVTGLGEGAATTLATTISETITAEGGPRAFAIGQSPGKPWGNQANEIVYMRVQDPNDPSYVRGDDNSFSNDHLEIKWGSGLPVAPFGSIFSTSFAFMGNVRYRSSRSDVEVFENLDFFPGEEFQISIVQAVMFDLKASGSNGAGAGLEITSLGVYVRDGYDVTVEVYAQNDMEPYEEYKDRPLRWTRVASVDVTGQGSAGPMTISLDERVGVTATSTRGFMVNTILQGGGATAVHALIADVTTSADFPSSPVFDANDHLSLMVGIPRPCGFPCDSTYNNYGTFFGTIQYSVTGDVIGDPTGGGGCDEATYGESLSYWQHGLSPPNFALAPVPGIMFEIVASGSAGSECVQVVGMAVFGEGTLDVEVHTKPDTYEGHEAKEADWTPTATTSGLAGGGYSTPATIPENDFTNVDIGKGATQSFFIFVPTNLYVHVDNSGNNIAGATFATTADITIKVGIPVPGRFSSSEYTGYAGNFFGTIEYKVKQSPAPENSSTGPPTLRPSASPTRRPTDRPTEAPTRAPTKSPTEAPTGAPTRRPTDGPTNRPTAAPTKVPTRRPTEGPTRFPTPVPVPEATDAPTHPPTEDPTGKPTDRPTGRPTKGPTDEPTKKPTLTPTGQPTGRPTKDPTDEPTIKPTLTPTGQPTGRPTKDPTDEPTKKPTLTPTGQPTGRPTKNPTDEPTTKPTLPPTGQPTGRPAKDPTDEPTKKPTLPPTGRPTKDPTNEPTEKPTLPPTGQPTGRPTKDPTDGPTTKPTLPPTGQPTGRPAKDPTDEPTKKPTVSPTGQPTGRPTNDPTDEPTTKPTMPPTDEPTKFPTDVPTKNPTLVPTDQPTMTPTQDPTGKPTEAPTRKPTPLPVKEATSVPTAGPTEVQTHQPTFRPTKNPTEEPTHNPTNKPTKFPTENPTKEPTRNPTDEPTTTPTRKPTGKPTETPTSKPTPLPIKEATSVPTDGPTRDPTSEPTKLPTNHPTVVPSRNPTSEPTNRPTDESTKKPTESPSRKPTPLPVKEATSIPTYGPTGGPTNEPTKEPTTHRTGNPTQNPTNTPTTRPTQEPTGKPTESPSRKPTPLPVKEATSIPTDGPTGDPTNEPTKGPTTHPTGKPSQNPTNEPTTRPTQEPTGKPTETPTRKPTPLPVKDVTRIPTDGPTGGPTNAPTKAPMPYPTGEPSENPTIKPTTRPTQEPTGAPTTSPTRKPTPLPVKDVTGIPTDGPTNAPTKEPTAYPTGEPSVDPTDVPSWDISSHPTHLPTEGPTKEPAPLPSGKPTWAPTDLPTKQETGQPSGLPSPFPSEGPSPDPSAVPSPMPTFLTSTPSQFPSGMPSGYPTSLADVDRQRTDLSPSAIPSGYPSAAPGTTADISKANITGSYYENTDFATLSSTSHYVPGIMFDLQSNATNDITVTHLDIFVKDDNVNHLVNVYTHTGSYLGSEHDEGSWEQISESAVSGKGIVETVGIADDVFVDVVVNAGDTQSFFVRVEDDTDSLAIEFGMRRRMDALVRVRSNEEVTVYPGVARPCGFCVEDYPGEEMAIFAGRIYYKIHSSSGDGGAIASPPSVLPSGLPSPFPFLKPSESPSFAPSNATTVIMACQREKIVGAVNHGIILRFSYQIETASGDSLSATVSKLDLEIAELLAMQYIVCGIETPQTNGTVLHTVDHAPNDTVNTAATCTSEKLETTCNIVNGEVTLFSNAAIRINETEIQSFLEASMSSKVLDASYVGPNHLGESGSIEDVSGEERSGLESERIIEWVICDQEGC